MLDICIIITLFVLALITSFIWVPIVILTSPLWGIGLLVLFLILQYTPLGPPVKSRCFRLYDWLLYKSQRPRSYLWRRFYDFLAWMFPQEEWKTMNYGYAVQSDTGHSIILNEEDSNERFSYQLYHFVATGLKEFPNLKGMTVLEVGSGRGGGLSYVKRYLQPEIAIGVDYSSTQVKLCQKMYEKIENLEFRAGDASNLPIEKESIDLVINVESAHCYPNFLKFVQEVERVLKPGGHFMFADFLPSEEQSKLEENLNSASLGIVKQQDITQNVILSLQFDNERRRKLIQDRTPWFLHGLLRHFSGTEGSNIYKEMQNRSTVYLAYHLVKPVSQQFQQRSMASNQMQEVFEYLDKDKSGQIDDKELIVGLRILGLNPTFAEVKELLKSQDKNKDGVLNFQEFCALFEECKTISQVNIDSVRQYFEQFDRDNSGYLDVHELKEALTSGGEALTDEQAQSLFDDFDVDNNGKINLLELVEALFSQ